jgi:Raf kinase inhibitor-like YbhB/YbcL family protein
MDAYDALITAGIIFGFISFMHLLRLIYQTRITIAEKTIPVWVSGIGFILPLLLSIWMFTASHSILQGEPTSLTLQSTAFNDGNSIPVKYTCNGENISPPLSWKDAPQNTKSFVLIANDPDAPSGSWDHWIIFNIPQTTHTLSENLTSLPQGAQYGKNSWEKMAYAGPCPPQGEHRYYFTLYALDTVLNLPAHASKAQIESAMQGHILADTKLMGRYKK